MHRTSLKYSKLTLAAGLVSLGASTAQADQVIADDLIVDGSICAGFDCVNGESFGFDTIRLKENNVRIKFDDTSSSASFPNNDWQLTANDSNNGGANKFSIDDISRGRTPFTIEANARNNALYVDSSDNVGFGTSNPAVQLHVVDGNTPTLRLEQNGSDGFTPQTWDLASNEANFFIRDATNGSQLPFRIEPGADTNALYIEDANDIGMGTNNPAASLHVRRTDGTAKILVEETSATASARVMMELVNNGGTEFAMTNTEGGTPHTWKFQNRSPLDGNDFRITNPVGPGVELILSVDGNLTISGSLTENSDKNNKMAIEPIDPEEILNKVVTLPLSTWTYKHDADEGIRHIGPMAQDFYALFGTGASENGISTIDTAGVALAAIQALQAQNTELLGRIDALEAMVAAQ